MLFNSVEFLIFFIFVLLAVTVLRKRNYIHLFLVTASYYFYWASSNYLLILLLFISFVTYYCGEDIYKSTEQKWKRRFLLIALVGSLGILGFFKYFNFAIDIINQSAQLLHLQVPLHTLNILLPIGISFYTFQGLSYVFDIYIGKLEPTESFYKYALFVAFFPQLVAGPIVRASHFLPQLKNNVEIRPSNLKLGVTLMTWGIVKKVVIADNIAPTVDLVFAHPMGFSSFFIIAATFLFGIQIYCDFSGYSDIAIGSARIIGFHLPQNFNSPYFTKSPTEFWSRWHISLSSYIKDYLYIPLGGNRKGRVRMYINLMITMLLCGLWHGAAWNFVIWGGYHGLLLSLHKIISKELHIGKHSSLLAHSHMGYLLKIVITQYFVFLGWLIFRAESLPDLIYCIEKFIFIDFIFHHMPSISLITVGFVFLLSLVVLLKKHLADWIVTFLARDWPSHFASLKLKYWLFYMVAAMLLLLCLSPSSSPEFIYFQF